MKQTRLLEAYIREILQEDLSWTDMSDYDKPRPREKASKGWLSKLKSFFMGNSKQEQVVEEWFEDQSMSFDFEIPDQIKSDAANFVKTKWSIALKRTRGDEEKAASLMSKALDKRYKRLLYDLDKKAQKEDEDL